MGKVNGRMDRKARRRYRREAQRDGRVGCGCFLCFPQSDVHHQRNLVALREAREDAPPEDQ